MFKKIGFAIAVSMMVLSACSSSESPSATVTIDCANAMSKCAKDPALTSENIATCKSLTTDKDCGSIFIDAFKCLADNQKCTADGVTDQDATKAACKAEQAKACSCAKLAPDASQCM